MKFEPRAYQSVILSRLYENKRTALFCSMGSGKTVCALTALENLSMVEQVYPVLVIAPMRVAKTTWPDEAVKWDHLRHLSVTTITGGKAQREKSLKCKADLYTINYENLPWLVEMLGSEWPFKTVIADESTKLKGFRLRQGTQRAKALAKVAHTLVNRIILLTGTPNPNGLLDLWGQVWFIDKGERLGKSFSHFVEKWFDEDYMGYNLAPKTFAQEDIQAKLKDVCLTVKVEDYVQIDKPLVNKIYVDLPSKVTTQYKKLEKEFFVQLEKEGIEALSAAALSMKLSQLTSGALYLENKEWEVIHDEKIRALESVIEEAAGMPVLVAYRFKSDLARLRLAFPCGRALIDADDMIEHWNAGKVPVLFVHPKSAGHGLNLQDGSNVLVFFNIDFNLEEHLQVIERIGPMRQKQAGHARPVFLHYILARDTIDEQIFERLTTKKSVMDVFLDAMKRNGRSKR